MNSKNKKRFVPDVFEATEAEDTSEVAADGIMGDASHFISQPETQERAETLEALSYTCTACFDVFTADELGENKDVCPTCKETDCIMER